MRVRLRLFVGLLAATAILSMAALTVAAHDQHGAPGHQVVITASVTTSSVSMVVRQARPRMPGRLGTLLPGVLLALSAGLLAVGVRLSEARRIGDAGDAWRSLLLGAPPVPASF